MAEEQRRYSQAAARAEQPRRSSHAGQASVAQADAAAKRSGLHNLVASVGFEVFWAAVIVSSSLFAGTHVHYMASVAEVGDNPPVVFSIIQAVYTVVFTLELGIRIYALRGQYFCGEGWGWNWFDVVIVLGSVIETTFDLLFILSSNSVGEVDANASTMRLVRLLRVTRLIRIFRVVRIVRFIRALRTLIFSIVCTLRSLIWAMFLMIMILYVFGILFTQAVLDEVTALGEKPEFYAQYWGSLPRAMLTLFASVSNGVSWNEVIKPLEEISYVWVLFFLIYICFTFFAVLNVVTGVFCQSAMEGAMHDAELAIQDHMKNKAMFVDKAKKLFKAIDNSCSGCLTIKELEKHMDHPEMQAYFQLLEIHTADAWTLFKLLDTCENHSLDCDDFVMGCMRLKGNAKSVDLAQLMYDQKGLKQRLAKFMSSVDTKLMHLTEAIDGCYPSEGGEFPSLERSQSLQS